MRHNYTVIKLDIKTRNIIKEECFLMIKGQIHNFSVLNLCILNNIASNFLKEKWTMIKGAICKSPIFVEDRNTLP